MGGGGHGPRPSCKWPEGVPGAESDPEPWREATRVPTAVRPTFKGRVPARDRKDTETPAAQEWLRTRRAVLIARWPGGVPP